MGENQKKIFRRPFKMKKKKLGLGLGFGFILRGRHEKVSKGKVRVRG